MSHRDSSTPEDYQLVPTRLQEPCADGTVRCHLCLWRCKLRHGQRGFCQTHVNRHGTLYNLSYGILSAIDVGAIEDKPVRHFRPGTRVMSVGSYGCNFRCQGCHNLDISWGVTELDRLARGESEAAWVPPEKLVQTALAWGVEGIAFTYSEPAVWLEYVLDAAHAAREAGLYTVYVSNSFVTTEALELIAPVMDVLCSDIKSLDDAFYKGICGAASVEAVLDSIAAAHRLGIHVETRTNIIPGHNDDEDGLRRISRWIARTLGPDSPWHITRFFPAYQLSHVPVTPTPIMHRAAAMAREEGLQHVYVYDDKGCDCAQENLPVADYLRADPETVHVTRKCQASCCGEEGILLKKYEKSPGRD